MGICLLSLLSRITRACSHPRLVCVLELNASCGCVVSVCESCARGGTRFYQLVNFLPVLAHAAPYLRHFPHLDRVVSDTGAVAMGTLFVWPGYQLDLVCQLDSAEVRIVISPTSSPPGMCIERWV